MSAVLRAGGLTATVGGDGRLGPVLVGGVRVLDAVYAAVRDPEWNTVPPLLTDLRAGPAEVTFTCRHDVGLRWTGRVTATGDTLTFTMDGTVERAFLANRVGFCLLHPIECAARPVTVHTTGGTTRGVFPDRIAPHQPFTDMTKLSYAVDRAAVEIELGGALFEMEDHRNWTDAGFKTYCTPLRLPSPVRHEAGTRIHQSVTIRLIAPAASAEQMGGRSAQSLPVEDRSGSLPGAGPSGSLPGAGPSGSGPGGGRVGSLPGGGRAGSLRDEGLVGSSRSGRIRIGRTRAGRLPEIGFGSSGPPPDTSSAALLRAAGPAYLYTELDLAGDWQRTLQDAAAEAAELGVRLDAGLIVPAGMDPGPALAALRRVAVGRVFGFDAATGTTSAALAGAIRAAGTPIAGGGSRAHFAEFNRADLPVDRLDALAYAVTPRVHHDDDRSMLDTLLAQPHTVRDARRVAGGRPVVVGPITLGPRENDQAAVRQPLPPDPRQRRPFAAAWTLGAIAALSRADALTFFTTWGPGGLVDDGPFPVHAVFAALAGRGGTELLAVDADPRAWAVLALDGGPVLIGNLSDRPAEADVDGTPSLLAAYEVRVLAAAGAGGSAS